MSCVQVVLDIALGAAADARPPSLAVMYDELLRKQIENKAGQLGDSWVFSDMLTEVNENVLRQARRQAVCLSVRVLVCTLLCCRKVPQVGQPEVLAVPPPPPKPQWQDRSQWQGKPRWTQNSGLLFCACMSGVLLLEWRIAGGAMLSAQPVGPKGQPAKGEKRGMLCRLAPGLAIAVMFALTEGSEFLATTNGENAPKKIKADVQCFKCKAFGHYSNKCPTVAKSS